MKNWKGRLELAKFRLQKLGKLYTAGAALTIPYSLFIFLAPLSFWMFCIGYLVVFAFLCYFHIVVKRVNAKYANELNQIRYKWGFKLK